MPLNKQIHLDNRPTSKALATNFKLIMSETPPLQEEQVLVRHHFLRMAPDMRGRAYTMPKATQCCKLRALKKCIWGIGREHSPACPAAIAASLQTACETASKHGLQEMRFKLGGLGLHRGAPRQARQDDRQQTSSGRAGHFQDRNWMTLARIQHLFAPAKYPIRAGLKKN